MEEKSYSSTHPLGHTGPVTGSLYLYLYLYLLLMVVEWTTETSYKVINERIGFGCCVYVDWIANLQYHIPRQSVPGEPS